MFNLSGALEQHLDYGKNSVCNQCLVDQFHRLRLEFLAIFNQQFPKQRSVLYSAKHLESSWVKLKFSWTQKYTIIITSSEVVGFRNLCMVSLI